MLPVSPLASQALPAAPATGGLPSSPAGGHQVLTRGDAATFERAAGASVQEVDAAPVQSGATLAGQIATGLQDVSVHLAKWQHSHGASARPASAAAPTDAAPPSMTKSMADAVASMQGAYTFAIETTLASRGSTEMTKVFNTLLKGQ